MPVVNIDWDSKRVNMPREMRDARRWLLYKLVRRKDGKADKVPYYINGRPRNGTLDSADDVAQLATYADAARIVDESETYAGLGFALGRDGEKYWQGIDIDNVEENQLQDIADSLPSYVEHSPSGKGVHAIGYGEYFNGKNQGDGIEYYSSGRFFTYTGKGIRNTGLTDLRSFIKSRINPDLREQKSEANHERGYIIQTPEQLDEIRHALTYIDPDCDYQTWKQILFSLHRIEGGVEMWAQWSTSAKQPRNRSTYDERVKEGYASLLTYRGEVNIATLFMHAIKAGYQPNSEAQKTMDYKDENHTSASRIDFANLNERHIGSHEFIIPNWLPTDAVTLFAGHGGTGKSWLSLQIAIDLAYGRNCLGHDLDRPYNVVFLSGEDSEQSVLWRAKHYMRAKIIDPEVVNEHLHVMNWCEKDTQVVYEMRAGTTIKPNKNFEELVETCEKYKADVLIVDNNSMFFGGNEIDRSQVQTYLSALRHAREKLAVIALHHVDKASVTAGNTDSFSGSTGWHNGARARWSIGNQAGANIFALRKSNYGKAGFQSIVRFNDRELFYEISEPIVKDQSAEREEKLMLSIFLDHINSGGQISTSNRAPKANGTNAQHILLNSKKLPENINEKTIWTAIEKMVEKGYLLVSNSKSKSGKNIEIYELSESAMTLIFEEEDE